MRWPKNQDARAIVRNLARRRLGLGLSQTQLELSLGCAPGYIAKLETHVQEPGLSFLLDWAHELRADLFVLSRPDAAQQQPEQPAISTKRTRPKHTPKTQAISTRRGLHAKTGNSTRVHQKLTSTIPAT